MLGMVVLLALNPVLFGLILLLISRPRPVQNLIVCWIGCLITNIPALLVPLLMLHVMPVFRSTAQHLATAGPNSTTRHVQLGMGVLALSISTLIIARSKARRRERVPTPVGEARPGYLIRLHQPSSRSRSAHTKTSRQRAEPHSGA
ncbi:hypothetical protein I552_3726 [Mycobacterium xenopi 3993]|nr:hypothetical protein I552_3726 [Mycobacterium xenopi 3993]